MRYINVEHDKKAMQQQRNAHSKARVGVIPFKWWFVVLATILFAIGLGAYYVWSFFSGLKVNATEIFKAPNAIVTYVANKDPQVKNEDSRMNIALLGIGGAGHDGPYLTDTMIVASVNIKNGNVVLLSLPRDIWVKATASKLNAVYAYGFEKGDKKGLVQAKDALSEITGLPIHYALRIDFSGFEKMIDLMGGIDITIDTAFVDPQYPISGKERDMCGYREIEEKIASESGEITVKKLVDAAGTPIAENVNPYACRYENLSFAKGPTQMNGKTALKFVRSRHGTNGEGSDFARSKRQQKIIAALREKIFSTGTLLNPTKVGPLLNTFGASIETDIEPSEYGEFFKVFQKSKDSKIISHNISADGQDALLAVPLDSTPYRGAYVLVPKAGAGNWDGIHTQVTAWLDESEKPPEEATKSATVQ